MNRQQRRSIARQGASPSSAAALPSLLAAAAEHLQAGRLPLAAQLYEQALMIRPDLADARANLAVTTYNMGNAANRAGRPDAAVQCYARAVELRPEFAAAHANLVRTLLTLGQPEPALAAAMRGVREAGTIEIRRLLVQCARDAPLTAVPEGLAELLARAFAEGWARPADIARAAARVLLLDPVIARHAGQDQHAGPDAAWPNHDLRALGGTPLLMAHLGFAPVTDAAIEAMLTRLRAALLHEPAAVGHDGLRAGLAMQCFINEYVFASAPGEAAAAMARRQQVEAALDAGLPVAPALLATAAMHAPLHALPSADRLLHPGWQGPAAALVAQQVAEPLEELRLRPALPQLMPITDQTSLRVQTQYEENPYPRWVRPDQVDGTTLEALLLRSFPRAQLSRRTAQPDLEVLVAGCGTGQHPITTARRFPAGRVLAVDLSLASLAYAARKTRELGVTTIEYAQADILAMGALPRRFDLIEASGVLHHLAEPLRGWQVLAGLLRPGGVMRLGFYSARGRTHVTAARQFIERGGFSPTRDGIRRARQALLALPPDDPAGWVAQSSDFFTVSACRDLLFHVQEVCLPLPEIGAFMGRAGLQLLGFDLPEGRRREYHRRFPGDPAGTDLGSWDLFESEHPDCFTGMYQFWVQSSQ